jgi:hypothetical protein
MEALKKVMYNVMYTQWWTKEAGMPKIRKQIYLDKKQDQQLKRLAETRGVSEAEVVRQAIDKQFVGMASHPVPGNPAAWKVAHETMLRLLAEGPLPNEGNRGWTREDLYEERLSRYGPRTD